MDLHEQLKDIKTQFRLAMNGAVSQSMREKGLVYKLNFGVELPRIKQIAARYEPNHELAQALWKEDIRECKILATLLQPVETFLPEIADIWVEDIRNMVDSGTIDSDTLDAVRNEYPYFVVPAILFLQQNKGKLDKDVKEEVLRSLALAFPDRTILHDLVGDDAGRFSGFYPPQEEAPTPDTDTTITSFLDRYGGNDDKELELLDRLIFNPVPPDYSQVLEQEGVATDSNDPLAKAAEAFDNILAQAKPQVPQEQPKVEPEELVKEPEAADDSMLSESLAKIFIKQGKYTKALEIIKNISLKFPEKSIYFADQIRFLQKLILNDEINKR